MDVRSTEKFKCVEKCLIQLNLLYSSIYSIINNQESLDIDTLELDDSKLLYNPKFIENLTIPELTFIIVHKIGHFLLLHKYRVEDRDLDIWNVACDLYINKAIVNEFGEHNNNIKIPKGAVYWRHIDLNSDTEESLYSELIESKDSSYLRKFKMTVYSLYRENKSIKFSVRSSGRIDNEHNLKTVDALRNKYTSLMNKFGIFNSEDRVYAIENKCKNLLKEERGIHG